MVVISSLLTLSLKLSLSQIEIRASLGVGESRISRIIKEVKAGTLGKPKENTIVPHALTSDDVQRVTDCRKYWKIE